MKRSGMLRRQAQRDQNTVDATELIISQFFMDTAQIALHEMGWGYDRIKRFTEVWRENRREYRKALYPKDPECDVAQEHMDRALLDIIKDHQELIPFRERYPHIKGIKY